MDVLARIRSAIGAAASPEAAEQTTAASKQTTAAAVKAGGPSQPSARQGHAASLVSVMGGAGRRMKRADASPAIAFRDNWLVIRSILSSPDQAALHHGIARTDLVVRLQDLCDSLVYEANRASEDVEISGPCMEMLLEGDVLGQLVKWTANDRIAGSQAEVVRLFASLIILLDERFLSRQAVHRPLVRLMRICVGDEFASSIGVAASDLDTVSESLNTPNNEDEERRAQRRYGRMGSAEMLGFEEQLVDMMCHVASRLRNTPELLIIFFRERGGDEQTRRAFNIAMTGSSGTPSRISTRAPSPTGSGSPALAANSSGLSAARTSAPLVSSPLRPPDSLSHSAAGLSPGLSQKTGDAMSQASSTSGLSYDFPLFSYLMRFVHRESRTGELARAGILFLVDVAFAPGRRNFSRSKASSKGGGGSIGRSGGLAARAQRGGRRSGASTPQKARIDVDLGIGPSIALARFMLESDFAEVLGAGVGAVFGLLPTKVAHAKSRSTGELADKGVMLVGQDESLGGTGNLKDDMDAAASGLALSNGSEVRGQTRLLCDLLEFTQDILRTTSRIAHAAAAIAGVGLGIEQGRKARSSPPPTSLELANIARSLTLSVSAALQTLFLESILYPSMLECSDTDYSSVAVLSYLEAMLSVLETESPLAECIVGWLVGRESEAASTLTSPKRERPNESRKTGTTKRKSTAMLQLERDNGNAASRQNAGYFNDALGRYTIRDLIVDNLQPSTLPMAAVAALRLATTLFSFHGRFTLWNVIRVNADDYATAFPTNLLSSAAQVDAGVEQQTAGDEDDDQFVYPGTANDSELFQQRLRKLARKTVGGRSFAQYHAEMNTYLSLVTSIERGKGNGEGGGADAATLSTGFDKYLDDAELGIVRDSMFGITMRKFEADDDDIDDNDDDALGGNTDGLAAIGLSGEHQQGAMDVDAQLSRECIRHRLDKNDRLLRTVLADLCHFWRNRPEVNVALTGLIAALAMCPLRSLEGFLSFPRSEAEQQFLISSSGQGQDDLATVKHSASDHDDDDRSDDEREFARKELSTRKPIDTALSTDIPVVVSILRGLVAQLEQQRGRIDNFDKLLSERRRGLLYVENLDEALKVSGLTDGDDNDVDLPTPYEVYTSQRSASGRGHDAIKLDAQVELIEESSSKRPISLPPPPSASPSQGLQESGDDGAKKAAPLGETAKPVAAAERSGFARFFGRASTTASKSDAGKAAAPVTPAPAPMPFAHHYLQTTSVYLDFGTLRLSSSSPWSSTYDCDMPNERVDADEADNDGTTAMVGTTKKRTRFRDAAAGSDSEAEDTFTYPGLDDGLDDVEPSRNKGGMYGKKKKKQTSAPVTAEHVRPSSAVNLSAVLDNAVVLEEFIKEILAILQARRAMGIDAVRFV